MKINEISAFVILVLAVFVGMSAAKEETGYPDYTGESIVYLISPLGRSEYKDLGIVDLNGMPAHLVTFKTKVLLLDDREKIYSDPETLLPYRTERTVSGLFGKEYITEEYDQKEFTVVIRKFKRGKLVNEQTIKSSGPIQNAITLLSCYLRRRPDLEIGWTFDARVPAEFTLELVSVDEITVPAGTFQAYHFKSKPEKFEIWVNKSSPQIPLMIKGKNILNYSLVMKKYSPQ